MVADLWPIICCTTFTSAPLAMARLAAVCLSLSTEQAESTIDELADEIITEHLQPAHTRPFWPKPLRWLPPLALSQ
jgi:hypothetical protein